MSCDYVLNNCPDAEYIIIVNNDQIIAKNTIGRLCYYSKVHPTAIIGSVSSDVINRNLVYD